MTIQRDFELCSLIFLFLFLLLSGVQKRQDDAPISASTGMLVLFTCISEVLELLMIQISPSGSQTLLVLLAAASLAVMSLVPAVFSSFFVRRHQQETSKEKLYRLLNLLPFAVCCIAIVLSIWNRYVFYVDTKGFHEGKLYWIFYVNYVIYAVSSLTYGILSKRRRRVPVPIMAATLVLGAMPAVTEFLFPELRIYNLYMTSLVFLAFNGEENSYRVTDAISGALNRESFLSAVEEAEMHSQRKHVFAIGMDNFKLINEIHTVEGGNRIMQQIVSALQTEFGRKRVYRLGGDMFALIIPGETECPKVLDTLSKVFARPYKVNDAVIHLSACIGIVHTEHHPSSELVSVLEYAVSQAKAVGKAETFEIVGDTVDAVKRRKAIEKAMMENIRQRRFEVHYQPIYDARKKRFHSMEALARLNVPGYGYVSPEEFIRIAEKNGTVLEIGLLVLEEACRFITETDLSSKGISYVEVNLSVVQCTHDAIYSSIREVLQKYNVPPEMINLELTESAAAYSEKKLIRNLARMSLMNLSFSLDDYGSGYSNINYIITLPFTIAKIDKYLVWAAAKSATSRIILEHIISMFHAIHLKIVTEGIEDAEMAEMVTSMGADYLQGYYYSKPVPKELLLERLEDGYAERFR